MKLICVTEVDAITKIPCTSEPQRIGPSMPAVKGYTHLWHDRSTWPVPTSSDGTYLRAPRYYGTCDDDADTTVAGVLQVLTEAEFNSAKVTEHEARKPYPSWIGDPETMTWTAPVEKPPFQHEIVHFWNESTVTWLAQPGAPT